MLASARSGHDERRRQRAAAEVAALYEACAPAICDGRAQSHDELFELNQAVFFDTNPIPIKYMMRRLGLLPKNEHRLPMVPATPEVDARLDGGPRAERA